MSRNKYPEITVENILEVSQRLFFEKGYDNTKIQDIADELGMTKGAIYHHFKSKEEIMNTLGDKLFTNNNPFEIVKKRTDLNGLEKMKNITLKKEDIGKGELVLINPDYTLKSTINNLVSFDEEYNNIKLNNIANYSLHLILNNINAENKIVPVSGYRTLEEQKDIYNTSLKENGREYTQKYVALPNASEHQTGLAIDLALNEENIDFICPKFPYYGICQSFRNIAPKYGFIERYKDEKKAITKISKEEWHFRYVGYPHSKIITEKDICLEEYIDFLKDFIYPNKPLIYEEYKIFFIPYKDESISLEMEENYNISGNNVDGFILTIKGEK